MHVQAPYNSHKESAVLSRTAT